MDRRKFLRSGSLTGIGLTTVGGWQSALGSQLLPHADPANGTPTLDLEEITVTELQNKMQSGEQTSVSITKAFMARIKRVGPGMDPG